MQRTKQQALMFLLGALIVGGLLGFSAGRALRHDASKDGAWFRREGMYDDLQLTARQRVQIDSVLDQRNCQMRALMDPLKPQADSIREAGQAQMLRIMTPEQRERFEARRTAIESKRKRERDGRGPKRPSENCR